MYQAKLIKKTKKSTISLSKILNYCAMILTLFPLIGYAEPRSPEITEQIKGHIPIINKIGAEFVPNVSNNYIMRKIDGIDRRFLRLKSKIRVVDYLDASGNYGYLDDDGDLDSKAHTVNWYIVNEKADGILKWAPFGTEFDSFTEEYITRKSDVEYVEIAAQHISEDGKVLTVPIEAMGKRIAFSITPRSATGMPIEGTELFVTDLNYYYGQSAVRDANGRISEIISERVGDNINNSGGYVLDEPHITGASTEIGEAHVILQYRYAPGISTYCNSLIDPCAEYYSSPLFKNVSEWRVYTTLDQDTDRGLIEFAKGKEDANTPVIIDDEGLTLLRTIEIPDSIFEQKQMTYLNVQIVPCNAAGICGGGLRMPPLPVYPTALFAQASLQSLDNPNLFTENKTQSAYNLQNPTLNGFTDESNTLNEQFSVGKPIYATFDIKFTYFPDANKGDGIIVENEFEEDLSNFYKHATLNYSWYSIPFAEIKDKDVNELDFSAYTPIIDNQPMNSDFVVGRKETYPSYTPTVDDIGNVIIFKLDMNPISGTNEELTKTLILSSSVILK